MATPQQLELDPSEVAAFRLDRVAPYTAWHENCRYFLEPPGKEHYRLLGYLASQLPPGSRVADLGTYLGFSALALSAAENVRVTSYDIADCITEDSEGAPTVKDRPNVELVMRNCFDDVANVLACLMIVCDVDPHDGVQERKLFRMLEDADYRGVVVCDDIKLNQAMWDFWQDIKQPKVDATALGHWSGTGVVLFGDAFGAPGAS